MPHEPTNRFEKRATAYLETARERARRVVDRMDQQPARSVDLSPPEVRELFDHSPHGPDAPSVFWQIHDQTLAEGLTAAEDPALPPAERDAARAKAHTNAELTALREVYPFRAELTGAGEVELDQAVEAAARLVKLVRAAPEAEPDEPPEPFGLPKPDAWPEDERG